MGRLFEHPLHGGKVYSCVGCELPLTSSCNLVSTEFRGRTGSAWLFSAVHNVTEGPVEDRMMTTGQHSISDIYCNRCGSNLGWKYLESSQESQKYKRGKYILERRLFKAVDGDDSSHGSRSHSRSRSHSHSHSHSLGHSSHSHSRSESRSSDSSSSSSHSDFHVHVHSHSRSESRSSRSSSDSED